MADFVLVIKGGLLDYSNPKVTGPHMAEWTKYSALVQQHGEIKGGAGLTFEGSVVGTGGSQPYRTHGPSTLTGYYHISAPDRATAERIAGQAPNIALGGTVEVRELLPAE